MEILKIFNLIIGLLFFLCYFYQLVYIPIALFKKPAKHSDPKKHRFAVLIAARNEEKVIGGLLDSLHRQTYDSSLTDIYVIADNCTDTTCATARAHGATVWERSNRREVGKGYALNELLGHIMQEKGESAYDGYFVFDADNVLEEDYIEQMNRTFSDGYGIVTGYRNSKNYGDNWITAGYSLWFLRDSRFLNGARMKLGVSSTVGGTGFLFSDEVLRECGGWNFFSLTEDVEFTAYNIMNGRKVAFCPDAVLYDEQPKKFSQSWKQRLRWAKGYINVSGKWGVTLAKRALKGDFSSFDLLMSIFPAYFLSFISLLVNSAAIVGVILSRGNIAAMLTACLNSLASMLSLMFVIGAVTAVSEWKNINAPVYKKILYIFTFPLFMLTYIPIAFCAVFVKVSWSPIEHSITVTPAEIRASSLRRKD
ncbi:MAG: glycosyltransferase family 2 protein [Eubacteriales bacterium]